MLPKLGVYVLVTNRYVFTCTFLLFRVQLNSRSGQFAPKVIFPKLSKPDIPAVVLQAARREVLIEPWAQQQNLDGQNDGTATNTLSRNNHINPNENRNLFKNDYLHDSDKATLL